LQNYLRVKDFLVSREYFDLKMDPDLEMLITTPQPENLSDYYESDAYISHTDESRGLIPFIYQLVKKYALRRKETHIKKTYGSIGSVLDIGAGTADFLVRCKNQGWKINGVEVNKTARELAKQKGIDLKENLDQIHETYDVITLWHVLEHLPDLQKSIERIENLLRPGGSLVIAVPNYRSYDARYYGEYWAAYDVPRHLWHFSQKSMNRLFSANLQLRRRDPMIFDAYYVSLLSEKYKTGSKFSLHAFWIGWKSNWLARSNKEYSSIIYTYKKV
jgi:SAM-dependent methyltransferase